MKFWIYIKGPWVHGWIQIIQINANTNTNITTSTTTTTTTTTRARRNAEASRLQARPKKAQVILGSQHTLTKSRVC
jgi:hypothetical protein